jgi:MFS family permease
MGVGGFISAVLFPPMNSLMIIHWGWRTAWVILAIATSVIMLPLAIIFFKNKPEDMGLTGEPCIINEAVNEEVKDDEFNRDAVAPEP